MARLAHEELPGDGSGTLQHYRKVPLQVESPLCRLSPGIEGDETKAKRSHRGWLGNRGHRFKVSAKLDLIVDDGAGRIGTIVIRPELRSEIAWPFQSNRRLIPSNATSGEHRIDGNRKDLLVG